MNRGSITERAVNVAAPTVKLVMVLIHDTDEMSEAVWIATQARNDNPQSAKLKAPLTACADSSFQKEQEVSAASGAGIIIRQA